MQKVGFKLILSLSQPWVDTFPTRVGSLQLQKILYLSYKKERVWKSKRKVNVMILADKIIILRKKFGWSQEEFAMRMNVSRQAVSKWEQAQSVPDLDKILLMANVFGVSTDSLLKDDIEIEEAAPISQKVAEDYPVRRVSMEDASLFLELKEQTRFWIALATSLCILSPVILMWLTGAAANNRIALAEDTAAMIGLIILIIFLAIGVAIFIMSGAKTSKFEYLEKESFEVEYGVTSMVKQKQEQFHPTYVRFNMIGTLLCILSVIPLFATSITNDEFLQIGSVGIILIMVASGVFGFVYAGVKWGALQQLLQEGDYSRTFKKQSKLKESISGIYWLGATAIYLFMSLQNNNWNSSWIIWPIAGVLFGIIMIVVNMFAEERH